MHCSETIDGTFEARPIEGTPGEVGFKCKVFSSDVAEETIEDLKKDSFVKSSFLTHTSVSTYICSAPYGPHLWTSEATFEDDDKASGIATKITLKLRFRPKGCIVLCDEEKGGNCPLWCLFPPVPFIMCLLAAPQLCLIFSCNNFEAGYSRQRAIVQRRVNAIKAGLYHGFTNSTKSFFPSFGRLCGGLPGAYNGMMGAYYDQQRRGTPLHRRAMQEMRRVNEVQMNRVPVATTIPVVVQTATAIPVDETTHSSESASAPPKSDM